jgi:SPP1 gp7 family putative phage head morphogenesis protein
MGFTLSEQIWEVSARTGEARWADILHRPHETCKFVRNPHGRTVGAVQRWNGQFHRFPALRTTHLNYRGGRRNPYGRSGYYCIYDTWQDKLDVALAYAIFLRRHGAGLASAKVPKSKWEDRTEMALLLNILDNVQGTDRVILPDWVDLSWESTASGAGEVYANAMAGRNMEITRGILGPDTAVAEALRVGARADTQGKTETMWTILHTRGAKLREQIEEGLFGPLVRWNLAGAPTPKLGTNTASPLQVKEKLEAWSKAYVNNILPKPTLDQQAQLLEELGVDLNDETAITMSAERDDGGSRHQKPLITAASAAQRRRYVKQRRERLEAMDMAEEELVGLYRETIGQAFQEVMTTAFPNGQLRRREKVKQPDGTYKEKPVSPSTLRDRLKITNKEKIAAKLFDLTWAERQRGKADAESNVQVKLATSAIGTQQISDTVARDLLRNQIYYSIQQTYGGLEQKIWHELDMIISGRQSEQAAINNIRMIMFESGLSDPRGGVTTLVRTNLARAYSDGRDLVYARHESLDRRGADAGQIIGYEVYATLDDSTTDECEALHGMCFLVGDPDMPYFPRHPNCRTDKFPIFGDEEPPSGHWLTEQERAKVLANPPAEGFGGTRSYRE